MTTRQTKEKGRIARWVVGLLLVSHGLIHALGPIEVWGIADIAELTGRPSIDLGATATDILAVLWLVALVHLVAAGLGVASGKQWWPVLAGIGVVVSQAVIFIWWEDAATGTIPNLLVIAAVVFADRLGLSSRPPAPPSRCLAAVLIAATRGQPA